MATGDSSPLPKIGAEHDLLCPSSVGHVGALAIAKRDANNLTTLLEVPVPISREFIEEHVAVQGAPLETAYRFASGCIQRKCRNWTDGKCGVAASLAAIDLILEEPKVPLCSIRERCRWFQQEGYDACYPCTHFPTRIERQSAVQRELDAK